MEEYTKEIGTIQNKREERAKSTTQNKPAYNLVNNKDVEWAAI